jgi:hypothetical protein
MNERDPSKTRDLNHISKITIAVAVVEPATGSIKLENMEFEDPADQAESSVYVNSGKDHLTPLDEY